MSKEFKQILELRKTIQDATHEMKHKLTRMHEAKGIGQPEKKVEDMGISELVLYVNELEDVVVLCG